MPEESAAERFGRLAESTALGWDHATIARFARLPDTFVVQRLLAAYGQERKAHPTELRALLANALGSQALSKRDVPRVRAFVEQHADAPEHAWASYQAFLALARVSDERAALREIVAGDPRAWRRIAALEALSRSGSDWLADVPAWAPRFLKQAEPARTRLLIALARAVPRAIKKPPAPRAGSEGGGTAADRFKRDLERRRKRRQAGKPRPGPDLAAGRAATACLRELLQEQRASTRVVAHVRAALGLSESESPTTDPAAPPAGGTRVRRAKFMSVAVDGDRIVFVVDASDSMLRRLTPAERTAFWKLLPKPTARAGATARKQRTASRRALKAAASRFRRVKTRYDAARLHLIATLRQLSPQQRFAIVLFGDKPELCVATPRLTLASPENVKRTERALKARRPGPASRLHPLGELLGHTNLYSALRTAFRLDTEGRVRETDQPGLLQGADQIFLLSDGAPNDDGFRGNSPEYLRSTGKAVKIIGWKTEFVETRDPETGALIERRKVKMPITTEGEESKLKVKIRTPYPTGPFVGGAALLLELQRFNLWRKASLHVVGLGEASGDLLQQVARQSFGTYLTVSAEKKP